MSENARVSLHELREKPFELLREMERRSRVAQSGNRLDSQAGNEWVGIGCQLAGEKLLVARAEIREVMMTPSSLTRVPGAKEWVAGLANLRGQILTVVDLRAFLGAGSSKGARAGRVLVVDSPDLPVGIIVDEVFGFRRFSENEFTDMIPDTKLRCERYVSGACARGNDIWPIFSIAKLLEASEFQKAAA
jgi:twitching motility protein PilI